MYIASASTTVKFHEFPNGQTFHTYPTPTQPSGSINSISWNKDGTWLAFVTHDGLTEVISLKDGPGRMYSLRTIKTITNPLCVRFPNTTRKTLTIGSSDGQIYVYDMKTACITKTFPRASSAITHIDVTPNDSHIAAAGRNGIVHVYNQKTNTLSNTFKIQNSKTVSALRYNRLKRNLLVGASKEGYVVVWDINSGKNKFVMLSHKAPVTATAFSPINCDLMVSCGLDRQFRFYDIVNNKSIADVTVDNSLMAVDFLPDGMHVVMSSQDGHIFVYDTRQIREPVHTYEAHDASIRHLLCMPNAALNTTSSAAQATNSMSDSLCNPNVSAEVTVQPKVKEANGRISDIFALCLPPLPAESSLKSPSESSNNADSFMMALGLENNNSVSDTSKPNNESIPRIMEEKCTSYVHSPLVNSARFIELKGVSASTPKLAFSPVIAKSVLMNDPSLHVSPIVNEHNSRRVVSVDEIERITKDAVRESIKSAIEEVKMDVKLNTMDTITQLKFAYVNIRMEMAKQFIQLENQCNLIREEMSVVGPASSDHCLMEENANLRRRIAFLESQLANLTFRTQNNNENGYNP